MGSNERVFGCHKLVFLLGVAEVFGFIGEKLYSTIGSPRQVQMSLRLIF
jgi:hypothetical protein